MTSLVFVVPVGSSDKSKRFVTLPESVSELVMVNVPGEPMPLPGAMVEPL